MKLGIDFRTGLTRSLTSWISYENPAPGSITFGVDTNSTNQLIVWWQGKVLWTSGIWQNGNFEFAPYLSEHKIISYISNENEKYFMFSFNKNLTPSRYYITLYGYLIEDEGGALYDECTSKNTLGCLQNLPNCRKPKDLIEKRTGYVFSEGFRFEENQNLSIFDCMAKCLANCSCTAYASTSDNNTGCEIWSQAMDFSEINNRRPQSRDVYFLGSGKVKWWIWLIIATTGVAVILIFCSLYYFIHRKHRIAGKNDKELEMLLFELGAPSALLGKAGKRNMFITEGKKNENLQFFSYKNIASATNNFSNANKLGEGGFGPVFKGKLHDGQEVAIKRLFKNSGQGVVEFKNEATLIAKLQHANLVRLIGCCKQKEEKILVYEYMPKKSLDFFLFDSEKKLALDWKKRLDIIEGIAQGLLYLHKYSRLRIIHTDLKASNILLDSEMNPKILDFGMARIVGPNECQANTKRAVGTYGYMSPEYAMQGSFSTKSDVFSFGVLLLEIVSGRKNSSFHQSDGPINLVGYAWELWREGRILELMDPTLADSYLGTELLRCIHIGLLCVEHNPADRPSMLDVIQIIYNETNQLPMPKQPAFHMRMNLLEAEFAGCNPENCSTNQVSISEMVAR